MFQAIGTLAQVVTGFPFIVAGRSRALAKPSRQNASTSAEPLVEISCVARTKPAESTSARTAHVPSCRCRDGAIYCFGAILRGYLGSIRGGVSTAGGDRESAGSASCAVAVAPKAEAATA